MIYWIPVIEQIFIWHLPRGPDTVTVSLFLRAVLQAWPKDLADALLPWWRPREGLMKDGTKPGRERQEPPTEATHS